MKTLLSFLLAGFLAIAAPASANNGSAPSLETVINALQAPFRPEAPPQAAITDFTSRFEQTSLVASLDLEQTNKGEVTVKFVSPSSQNPLGVLFLWQYQGSSSQQIVADGKTLWLYIPENHQVMTTLLAKVTDNPSQNPLAFLTGLGQLERDFLIRFASPARTDGGHFVLEMLPKEPSAVLQRLEIVVAQSAVAAFIQGKPNTKALPFLSTRVFDPNGNPTIINFLQPETNLKPADNIFRFVVPEGVEVVRPTFPEAGF